MLRVQDEKGRFTRQRVEPWSPDDWNDGYTDNRGRFRVYRPDCPRSYESGYALRAHVVWWLETGEPHPKGMELHHIDGSRDNDRIENLEPLSPSEHKIIHSDSRQTFECDDCGVDFVRPRWRYKGRARPRFCSRACTLNHYRGKRP